MVSRLQVDLMQRCVYGIVHPDDHHELKTVLEGSLSEQSIRLSNQRRACCRRSELQVGKPECLPVGAEGNAVVHN